MTPSNLLREIADAMDRGGKWWEEFEWRWLVGRDWMRFSSHDMNLMLDCVKIFVRTLYTDPDNPHAVLIRRIPRPEVWPG